MPAAFTELLEVAIARLGAMGDGIGEYESKPVYVPLTCAGDVAAIHVIKETKREIRGELVSLQQASPDRTEPDCQHFAACGGCSLQHLNAETYASFKQNIVLSFLRGLGLDESLCAPIHLSGAASRRRAEFAVSIAKDQVTLGFHATRSHDVIALKECPIVAPEIWHARDIWQQALQTLKHPKALKAIRITKLDGGVECLLYHTEPLKREDIDALKQGTEEAGFLRVATQMIAPNGKRQKQSEPETLYDSGAALVCFGGQHVALPVGAFLQASEAGEAALVEEVLAGLSGCKRVADLYSGCGTFSFPLAGQGAFVTSFEGDSTMITALNDVAHDAVKGQVRDLFNNPLSAKELNAFDGLVINPPRNGALPQMQQIAKSQVSRVVMVSCDPATFKRDACCLLDEGYTLERIVPVDQFTWSRHLEVVGVFSR